MKISAIEQQYDVKNAKSQNVSFEGLERTVDNVYKFFAPPYDKDKYDILLEVCPVVEDGRGGFKFDEKISKTPITINKSYNDLRLTGVTVYPRTTAISNPSSSEYMGYRFRLVDKKDAANAFKNVNSKNTNNPFSQIETKKLILDAGTRMGTQFGEFTVVSNRMGVTPKSGSAIHMFYDTYAPKMSPDKRSKYVRNHFNKALGSVEDFLRYPDEIKPYRYVMTNPYIGVDSVSSHKYWGENFFRVPSQAKFREVITELYRQGKSYIADGAFTSQSIQSPLFQDVLKKGKESYFYDWFKVRDKVKVGIFPDKVHSENPNRPNPLEHIGFKIINAMGTEGYDHNRPSYIQFFDDRLASVKQQLDTKNLITSYDNANPKDHYDITTHQDSIQPYFFELDYSSKIVRNKFTGYNHKMLTDTHEIFEKEAPGSKKIIDNLDAFFSFDNFDIVRKGRAAGADFWDGNTDLVKMNLSNPGHSFESLEGSQGAREYLWDVATHWTKFANDSLVAHIAKAYVNGNNEEIAQVARANGLPDDKLAQIVEEVKKECIGDDAAQYDAQKIVKDVIDNFKYPTLDVSVQIQPALFTPQFKAYMNKPESREILTDFVLGVLVRLNESMGEKIIDTSLESSDVITTEDIYKLFGKYITGNKVRERSYELADSDNRIKLTKFGKEMLEMWGSVILGYALLKGMFPDQEVSIDPAWGTLITSRALKDSTLYDAKVVSSNDVKEDGRNLAKNIINNLRSRAQTRDMQWNLSDELIQAGFSDYTLESLKFAREFVKQTQGGLNWRFDAAKDVADLTAARNGMRSVEQSLDDIIEIWGNFVKNVRKINPSSYVVLELTDLWALRNLDIYKVNARYELGKDASESDINSRAEFLREIDWGKYIDPNVAERMINEKTGATTGSQYSVFFNLAPNLFSKNFEHGNKGEEYDNLNVIKDKLEAFMKSGPLLSITHAHIFWDNHDKPRGPHCLALDMGAYLSRFGINVDSSKINSQDIKAAKLAAENVLGLPAETTPLREYDLISSKAVVVGDMYKKSFARVLKNDPVRLDIINEAIKNLALGHFKDKQNDDFIRAEAFGQLPFEITINDVMEEAGYIAAKKGIKWYSKTEAKQVADKAFEIFMTPAMDKLTKMTEFLCATTGMPFFYAGDNLGQSGYEYATKNITQANRNLIRHEWIDPNSSEYKPFIKKYYDKTQAVCDLNNKYGLSAIAGGMPISLPQADSKRLYALLKYDSKGSNVIQVFTNLGIDSNKQETMEVPSISMKDENGVEYKIDYANSPQQYLKRKVYDENKACFTDELDSNGNPVKYVVADGKLRRADGEKIVLNDTVTTFYKPLINPSSKHLEIMNRYNICF